MKIVELDISNLGPIAEATLKPGQPVVLLLGHNAQGKSMVCRAIELALRGGVAALDGSREVGPRHLIGPAGPTATVRATLAVGERAVPIRRTVAKDGVSTDVGAKGSTKAAYDYFSAPAMRDPASAWLALTNASGFFDLEDAAQQRLVSSLIEQHVPAEALTGLPIKDYVKTPTTLAEVARAHKEAFVLRTTVNRERKDLRVPPAPSEPRVDVAAIDTKLGELRQRERELIASTSEAQGAQRAAEERLRVAGRALDEAAAARERLGDRDEARVALGDARRALADAQSATPPPAGQRGKLLLRRDTLATALGKLKELGSGCVIHSDLGCPLSATKRAETIKAWEKTVGTLAAEIEKIPTVAPPPLATFEHAVTEANRRVAAIEEAESKLEAARESLRQAQEGGVPVVETPPELAQLRERLTKGEGNLRTAREINAGWDTREAALAKAPGLEQQAADLDVLVEAFGDKGLSQKLLGERVAGLLGAINRTLAAFGMQFAVSGEPWAVLVNGRHPRLMSASERFRAGVALQIALAEVTGAKWALIDGADILDKQNRASLFMLLGRAVEAGTIEQAFVTATVTQDEAFTREWPAPFEAYRVEGGAVVPLGKVAA